jgi:hypothetical protein
MKKFYVTLVALLIATVSFAQVANLPFSKQEPNTQNEPAMKKVAPFHLNQSKGVSASAWFCYFPDFFQYYSGLELGDESYGWRDIHCDTNVQVHFSDGDATVNFNGFGQIFSFADPFWQIAVQEAHGIDISLPDMTSATTYSVDSISIPYVYWRGSIQPTGAIDTMIVSVLGDLTEADLNYVEHTAGFVYSGIKYDTVNFVLKAIAGKKYHVAKIPLLDTVVEEVLSCDIALPGFTNLSNKNLVIFYTYKPGIRANHNQFINDEVGRFRGLVIYDPRTEYEIGGTLATTERNNSINAMVWTFNGNNWPEYLLPTSIWDSPSGIMRPSIYAKITCDNCSMGSITEMAKKNVTISPNPATSNFTVDLGATGKSNVEMFNLVGQKVYSNSTNDSSITVNVSDLKSGVYMLKISQNGQVYTSKVVVK